MRGRHRGAKHHIKFDEGEECVYLNVRLKDDPSWTQVYREDAEEWIRQMRQEDAKRLNKRMATSNVNTGAASSTSQTSGQGGKGPTGPFAATQNPTTRGKMKTSKWTGRAMDEAMA